MILLQETLISLNNDYGTIITITCILIGIDLLTGLISSHIHHTTNSSTGRMGFWKKFALILALIFCITIDIFVDYLVNKGLVAEGYFSPIGHLSGIYIAINECISICENLKSCGIDMSAIIRWRKK